MLTTTLLFPYPKPVSGSEPVVNLPNIFASEQPKKIEIKVVDSEYLIAKKKAEQEAALKRKARLRAIPKVSFGVKILYRDNRYGDRSCVRFAKAQTGITRSIGNGGRSGIQGRVPRVGSIGVERYRIHAVVVTAVNGNMVTFKEAAFMNFFITQRTLPVSHFLGFIYN